VYDDFAEEALAAASLGQVHLVGGWYTTSIQL
jgi:hypothetical protein